MKIAVVDRDFAQAQQLKTKLQNQLNSPVIVYFEDLNQVHSVKWDFIFLALDHSRLDEELKKWRKFTRSFDASKTILMVSPSDQFVEQLFLNNSLPAGVLTKPIQEKVLQSYISKIRDSVENQYLEILVHCTPVKIPFSKIMYLESNNHYVTIVCKENTYQIRSKLSEVEKKLPRLFCRCHQSYIVNLDLVSDIKNNTVFLENGINLPMSRGKKKQAFQQWIDHLSPDA